MDVAPSSLAGGRVLRYAGDPTADWTAGHDAVEGAFQGRVIALAVVDDEPTGGVITLFLYADGSVADEWQASLEDALEALEDTDELNGLSWAS